MKVSRRLECKRQRVSRIFKGVKSLKTLAGFWKPVVLNTVRFLFTGFVVLGVYELA